MLNNKKVLFFFLQFSTQSCSVLPQTFSCCFALVNDPADGELLFDHDGVTLGPWWPLVAPELPAAAEGPCGTRLRGSGAPGCPGGGVMMGGDTEGRTWAH